MSETCFEERRLALLAENPYLWEPQDKSIVKWALQKINLLHDELAAEREKRELAERQRDEMAARLESVRQWAVNWQAVYPHIALPDTRDGDAILAARDKATRRKGATWGVRRWVNRLSQGWNPEESLPEAMERDAAAIESGTVEVGE